MSIDKEKILNELHMRVENIYKEQLKNPSESYLLILTTQKNTLLNVISWIQTGMRVTKSRKKKYKLDKEVQSPWRKKKNSSVTAKEHVK